MHMSIRRVCTPPNLPTKSSVECCESASTVLAGGAPTRTLPRPMAVVG